MNNTPTATGTVHLWARHAAMAYSGIEQEGRRIEVRNAAANIVVDDRFIVVAVAGSDDIGDWIANIDGDLVPFGLLSECRVHHGFAVQARLLSSSIERAVSHLRKVHGDLTTVYVGHSLGGAVAQLLAIDLWRCMPVSVFAFGAPRVGDRSFVAAIERCVALTQVHNVGDIVPHLPPLGFRFRHAGRICRLSESGDIVPATLDSYWQGLKAIVGARSVSSSHSANEYLKRAGQAHDKGAW